MGHAHSHAHGGHGHTHSHSHGHGHSHGEADLSSKMLPTTVLDGLIGRLTSHISSSDGNELDVFFVDTSGKPKTTKMERFTATVKDQSGACFDVVFEPAPADERPQGETDGCSHYVGKAGSLKAVPSALTVTAQMTLNGAPVTAVWSPFDPVKYAHHVE